MASAQWGTGLSPRLIKKATLVARISCRNPTLICQCVANLPTGSAQYEVSIRQLIPLLQASFRQTLTRLPLPSASRFRYIS